MVALVSQDQSWSNNLIANLRKREEWHMGNGSLCHDMVRLSRS